MKTEVSNTFPHELQYRGPDALAKLASIRLTVCGAGALGSHLCDNLARQGITTLRVIDHDRVEASNVGTQLYGISEVGAWKAEALRNRVFRACNIQLDAITKEMTERNARNLLKESDLVVDVFDNSDSRRLVQECCRDQKIPCLHVGLFADYAEAIWDEDYRVPADGAGDVCEYPLARNLVMLATAVASEIVICYVTIGVRLNRTITLKDLCIAEIESAK